MYLLVTMPHNKPHRHRTSHHHKKRAHPQHHNRHHAEGKHEDESAASAVAAQAPTTKAQAAPSQPTPGASASPTASPPSRQPRRLLCAGVVPRDAMFLISIVACRPCRRRDRRFPSTLDRRWCVCSLYPYLFLGRCCCVTRVALVLGAITAPADNAGASNLAAQREALAQQLAHRSSVEELEQRGISVKATTARARRLEHQLARDRVAKNLRRRQSLDVLKQKGIYKSTATVGPLPRCCSC